MAQLEMKNTGSKSKKRMQPFVDLAAMVDLAFLLITFFMLTTTLSKPQSMNLAMPDKEIDDKNQKQDEMKVADWRTMTVLLGTDDKLVWFMGQQKAPIDGPHVAAYGKDGIRPALIEKGRAVLARTQKEEEGLIVIIKPSERSTYHNLVDILDEMAITKTKTYAIVDIEKSDVELLEKNSIYNEVPKN